MRADKLLAEAKDIEHRIREYCNDVVTAMYDFHRAVDKTAEWKQFIEDAPSDTHRDAIEEWKKDCEHVLKQMLDLRTSFSILEHGPRYKGDQNIRKIR